MPFVQGGGEAICGSGVGWIDRIDGPLPATEFRLSVRLMIKSSKGSGECPYSGSSSATQRVSSCSNLAITITLSLELLPDGLVPLGVTWPSLASQEASYALRA